MGLDVYMEHRLQPDRYKMLQAVINTWERKGNNPTPADIEEWQKLGLTICGSAEFQYPELPPDVVENVTGKSVMHPDHYFNLGYFRSSYNSGGFNSVVGDLIGVDLYSIFGQDGSNPEYYFTPDWDRALDRANAALVALKGITASDYGVAELPDNVFGEFITQDEALKRFAEQTSEASYFGNFSNSRGYFLLGHPLLMRAWSTVPGKPWDKVPPVAAVFTRYEVPEGKKPDVANVRVVTVPTSSHPGQSNAGAVLDAFLSHKQGYSTIPAVTVLQTPLYVMGVFLASAPPGGHMGIHLIVHDDPFGFGDSIPACTGSPHQWYVEALEVVIEACENVLSKPDPQNYALRWSS